MQQFAVNSIFGQMANSAKGDILSVNGPPGTGKTTLLRDIICSHSSR
jgi:ABC-type transport system involved in cytochrome c biogenesis ATPase subunit